VTVQIQSIERAAAILRLLTGRSRRWRLAELADELQLSRGTVHGILRTLRAVGFVEQDADSGRYQLGAALLHIGSIYLDGNDLRRSALGAAEALAAETSESVRIGTLHENVVLIVHDVLGPDERLRMLEVGRLMPLHATALGKALLIQYSDLAAELSRQGLTSCTSATITDFDRLNVELDQIAKRGWAGDVGEFLPGVASIAAPIEGRRGSVVGAIAICGPMARIYEERSPRAGLVDCVMQSARRISRELGGSSW
jgi:DNA-binding IclR family transcriptional regulator